MSQGRATFTMEFDQYAEAPTNVAEAGHQEGAELHRAPSRSKTTEIQR